MAKKPAAKKTAAKKAAPAKAETKKASGDLIARKPSVKPISK